MGHLEVLDNLSVNELLDHLPEGMFIIDADLIIRYANPAFCKLVLYSCEELLNTSITQYLGDLSILESCMLSVGSQGYCNDQETIFNRKDGSVIHIVKNVQAMYTKEGDIRNILVTIRDLTHLHELNKELAQSKTTLEHYNANLESMVQERTEKLTVATKQAEYQLLHDSLTALPNRLKLLKDMNRLHVPHAIILINIDSFNEFNTFYGHIMGDALLNAFATLLSKFLKTIAHAHLYKLPVDEYAILLRRPFETDELASLAGRISQWIANQVFTIDNQQISLSATLGAAYSASDLPEDQYLLAKSDMALKHAKKGRHNFTVYDQSLLIKENYEKNLSWIKRLKDAIDEDRIVPFFQPIVDNKSAKTTKYEALVRIIEDDGTVITPYHFLEIAKKVKLYSHITITMIDKVYDKLLEHPDKTCSINLSIKDIQDEMIRSYIIDKVRHSAQSNQIIFEILESEGIQNYDIFHDFIREVKKYGAKIALDDFGSGYSNFAYVTRFNIDYIKIDGSIIRDIDTNPASQIITQTIIDFATKLGIETVAEFVSNEAIYRHLQNTSIDYLQGFYLGEPAPDML